MLFKTLTIRTGQFLASLLLLASVPGACAQPDDTGWNPSPGQTENAPVMGEVSWIGTDCPEVSGLCLAPDGGGLIAASDEKGLYRITWDGGTTPFLVKWRMDCEGVTFDPETGDIYYIVEGLQQVWRLKAPEYGRPEKICTIRDAGYLTNRGLEGITWFRNGTLLLGNQRKPTLLIRYSLKVGTLSQKELTGVSEIAGLCYDPIRNTLWIADSERHTINMCTPDGELLASWTVPFIDNAEGICVDHGHGCIWVGDDTTSRIYRISFENL